MTAIESVVDEELSERRVLVESVSEIPELIEEVVISLASRLEQSSFLRSDFFGSLVRECLPTPDTRRFFARCLSFTARAFQRSDLVLFDFFDFETMESSVLSVRALTAKAGNISSRRIRSSLTALSILDQCLRGPLSGQPTGVRLSKGSRCNGFLNISALGWLFEHLEVGVVAHPFWVRELRPQRCVANEIGRAHV